MLLADVLHEITTHNSHPRLVLHRIIHQLYGQTTYFTIIVARKWNRYRRKLYDNPSSICATYIYIYACTYGSTKLIMITLYQICCADALRHARVVSELFDGSGQDRCRGLPTDRIQLLLLIDFIPTIHKYLYWRLTKLGEMRRTNVCL